MIGLKEPLELFLKIVRMIEKIFRRKERDKRERERQEQQRQEENKKELEERTKELEHKSPKIRSRAINKLCGLAKSGYRLELITKDLCAHLRHTTQNNDYKKKYKNKPSDEIRSLFNELNKLNAIAGKESKTSYLDLSGSYLAGVITKDACLNYADLSRIQLQNAKLRGAQMRGVNLEEAQLQKTNLEKAQMQGVSLNDAQLQKAQLSNAQLQGAGLYHAQLQGANLEDAQLQGANLEGANLMAAYLRGTQLQGSKLMSAQLQGASSSFFSYTFVIDRIKDRSDKATELEKVIFSGGLKEGDVKRIQKTLQECVEHGWMENSKKDEIEKILEEHKDKPSVNKLPEDSGASTGILTKEKADKMIAEYDKAMGKKQKKENKTAIAKKDQRTRKT